MWNYLEILILKMIPKGKQKQNSLCAKGPGIKPHVWSPHVPPAEDPLTVMASSLPGTEQ